jgi:hypothetical protein
VVQTNNANVASAIMTMAIIQNVVNAILLALIVMDQNLMIVYLVQQLIKEL